MPRPCRRLIVACALALWGSTSPGLPARADGPPTAAIGARPSVERMKLQRTRESNARASAAPSNGWWLGTAGMVAALAALGGLSVAAKRWKILPGASQGPLEVVGRVALSPRHSVYLLRAGDRVLIVGAGNQGAPSLLGELTGRDDLATPGPAPRIGGGR